MKIQSHAVASSFPEDRHLSSYISGMAATGHRTGNQQGLNGTLSDYLGRLAALGSLAQRESSGEVISQAISLACGALQADYCALFELKANTRPLLVIRHGSGWHFRLDGTIALDDIIELNGHIDHAFDLGMMIDGLVPDLGSRLLRFMRSHRVSSGATAAIDGKDGLLGILGIYTTNKRQFVQAELDLLQITANIIGAAITAEREAADRAHAAAREAARLKSAFLANTTHEIRSPLNVIMGYSELVAENLTEAGDESQLQYLEAVRRAGMRLLGTVDQILAYAKLECGEFKLCPEWIDLSAIVNHLVEKYRGAAEAKGLTLGCQIESEDTNVCFDRFCLEGVIANPLVNAIKFTESGHVKVRLYRADNGQLKLEISDTGIGMDTPFLTHLFEPFVQEDVGTSRRYEGTGLSLALTRRYAELNHASIEVRSVKRQGTSFIIEFSEQLPQSNSVVSDWPREGRN
jgi:signal transduction histidine kinase